MTKLQAQKALVAVEEKIGTLEDKDERTERQETILAALQDLQASLEILIDAYESQSPG